MSGFVPGTAPKDVDLAWPPELEAMITKKFSDLKFYKLCLFFARLFPRICDNWSKSLYSSTGICKWLKNDELLQLMLEYDKN